MKGTYTTKYYARDIDGGLFRSIWPNQHPSFGDGEGTASFTDLLDFEWAKDGQHSAMVVLHKSKGEEVLLETMNVRFTGPGSQAQPAVAPDGTRLVVVSTNTEGNSDLWVADTVDAAPILQLTFTPDSESSPAWHPKKSEIIHEVRNPLGSDIYVFNLDSFEHSALVRLGTSDEVAPSYSPDGGSCAFLPNKHDPEGLRWDLFIADPDESLPRAIIRNVRRSEKSLGYCWSPLGRYVFAVQDDPIGGHPLVVARTDGSEEPMPFVDTRDNMDPTLVPMGAQIRLVWSALDMDRPEDKRYRVIHLTDFDLSQIGTVAGSGGEGGDSARGG